MCILCVVQKWSRRVATMLPWLVIPLIGLWALSQLLPPDYRFEITSPRLACVCVLLVTLFWYEVLMPQLSAWRIRRNARLRERKRFEAIELQKLRKTATRRCRNCQTPYRDQNPGGGRFMCSYCGHISKRPVLDLPVPPGLGISNSGIIKDLVGKGGKILNGKGWSENGWMCGQDWLENGNWVAGSVSGKPSYWRTNGTGVFEGDEDCLAENSGIVIFACKLLTTFFSSIRWLLRKIFRVSSSTDDASSDSDHRGVLTKRGENGTSFNESRGEKARRKAEERRQARLEKELLEEEEKKQREEVARLVEERRRLRDEKLEAEKDRSKLSSLGREKDIKKEVEKKHQERKKEKDKVSSKSNSDAEEIEKRAGKENERKRDIDKKSEIDQQDHQNSGTDNVKGYTLETGHGMKNASANNFSQGIAGARYFDRMRGTFLSSSKAFTGSSFFGKSTNTPATVTKENKTNNFVDHVHTSAHRRDICPSERVSGKLSMNGDDKNVKINHPVLSEPHPRAAPKKSWQQLFTRSSSVPPFSNANVISRPNSKIQSEAQSPPSPGHSAIQTFDNPINFGLPSPFISMYPNGAPRNSLGFSPAIEPIFPCAAEGLNQFIPEEPELFEDPCYVPDLASLLGPISESLDNFQLDLGAGCGMDMGMEKPRALKNLSASSEINKPSPIESPFSRLHSTDERHNNSNRFLTNPKTQDLHTFPVADTNANKKGTWQMWKSSPLGQDGLGLVGGPASWLLPFEHNRSNKEDSVLPSTQKTMASLFTREDHIPAGTQSPQKVFLGNGQNGGTFSPVTGPSDHDLWLQNAFVPPLSGTDNHFPVKPEEEMSEMSYGSPSGSACSHPFEPPHVNCWSKKEWAVQGSGEAVVKSSVARPPNVGGLFPTPDVQSHW